MKYRSELVSKQTVAEGTMSFSFKKPDEFAWKAGQSIDLTLVDPSQTDAEGNTRAYSIAAAPSEPYIMIATRMRDTAFKKVLKEAEPGLAVDIEGPFGSFTLHQADERPAIMLVGGIGITPFMSIIKDATEKALPHKIYLFYSNRRPEDAAFVEDLNSLSAKNQNFVFVPTMTDMDTSSMPWSGEVGRITQDMLDKHVPNKDGAIYYSAGPRQMVAAMREMLNRMGVSDDDIRTEEFSGY